MDEADRDRLAAAVAQESARVGYRVSQAQLLARIVREWLDEREESK